MSSKQSSFSANIIITIYPIIIISILISQHIIIQVILFQININKGLTRCNVTASQMLLSHLPPAMEFLFYSEEWTKEIKNLILRVCPQEKLPLPVILAQTPKGEKEPETISKVVYFIKEAESQDSKNKSKQTNKRKKDKQGKLCKVMQYCVSLCFMKSPKRHCWPMADVFLLVTHQDPGVHKERKEGEENFCLSLLLFLLAKIHPIQS